VAAALGGLVLCAAQWRTPPGATAETGHEKIAVKIFAASISRLRGENLTATSCSAPASCVSVGSYQNGDGIRVGLVLTERSAEWRADGALPSPMGSTTLTAQPYVPELAGVSCVSTVSCVAVANYPSPRATGVLVPRPLVLIESHGRWRSVFAPSPAGAESATETLRSISCSATSRCVVTGSLRRSTSGGSRAVEAPEAVLISNSTGRWTARFAPLPPDADRSELGGGSALAAVSCPESTACTAIGTYTTSSDTQQGLLLEQSGANWKSSTAPLPRQGDGVTTLDGLSCTPSKDCVAVGAYSVAGVPFGFLLVGHVGRWVAFASPHAAVYNTPYGISCPSVSSCVIAGIFLDAQYAQHGVVLVGAPSSLVATQTPPPKGAGASPSPGFGETLSSVSCSGSFCQVVGTYVGSASSESGIVLTATLPSA